MSFPDISTDAPLIPLMDVVELKQLLGLPAGTSPADAQLAFALEVTSSLITDYVGRRLVRGTYEETFYGNDTARRTEEQGTLLFLTESPVLQVTSLKRNGVEDAGLFRQLHRLKGSVLLAAMAAQDAVSVTYVGGYLPIPASLRSVVLELARRQLASMGVDITALGGSGAADLPIRAVSIGALRVEYAISLTASSAKGATPAANADMLAEFSTVLDLYRSPRRVAALPA